jgi:hypothetical protein
VTNFCDLSGLFQSAIHSPTYRETFLTWLTAVLELTWWSLGGSSSKRAGNFVGPNAPGSSLTTTPTLSIVTVSHDSQQNFLPVKFG